MVTAIQYRIYYKYAPISHLGLVQMNQGLFDYLLKMLDENGLQILFYIYESY